MKIILFVGLLLSGFTLFAQVKVGVIDTQMLIDSLPSRIVFIGEQRLIQRTRDVELKKMDSTLNVLISEFNNANLKEKSDKQKELYGFESEINIRKHEIDEEFQKLNDESIRKSKIIIKRASDIVSKKMSLDMIIDSSATLYFSDKLDVTKQVFTEMVKIDQLPR